MKHLKKLATLLYIDTAGEKATVAISQNGKLLALQENGEAQTHSSFLHVAIENLIHETKISLASMDAIVVTKGPGSYTGLRVGMSSAKGIAYALDKPLIGLSTLALLAKTASKHPWLNDKKEKTYLFAMIDARRMEVFGAMYDTSLNMILPEQALEINTEYLSQLIAKNPILCIGSAASKAQTLIQNPNIFFVEQHYDILDGIEFAEAAFAAGKFEDVAYTTPSYLKEFYFKK